MNPASTNNIEHVNRQYSPANTVIAFDLHKVLVKQNFMRISWRLFKRHWKAKHIFFKQSFIKQIRQGLRENLVVEKIAEKLSQKYPELATLKQDLIEFLNTEPLLYETIALAKELKSAGYSLILLSNIAQETFDDLKSKQPVLATLFDDIYIPSSKNNFICKPQKEFYTQFKQHLKQSAHANKTVFFIDDRLRNITAAGDDIIGIVFKSPIELRKQLTKYGLIF